MGHVSKLVVMLRLQTQNRTDRLISRAWHHGTPRVNNLYYKVWGVSVFLQEHKNSCKFGSVQCPNSIYGCKEKLIRSQLQDHFNNKCNFNPITCRWCGQRTLNEDVSYSCTRPFNTLKAIQCNLLIHFLTTSFPVLIMNNTNTNEVV